MCFRQIFLVSLIVCGLNVPDEFVDGVKKITVFNATYNYYGGIYKWNPQVIFLYDGCNQNTLVHELAHHKNKMDGWSNSASSRHGKVFMDAELVIKENRGV